MFSRFQAITFIMKIYKKTDMEQQGILDRKKLGFSRILEAFGRLWAYFCPPFARLLGGRISKRKKRGLCPDLGRPWPATRTYEDGLGRTCGTELYRKLENFGSRCPALGPSARQRQGLVWQSDLTRRAPLHAGARRI